MYVQLLCQARVHPLERHGQQTCHCLYLFRQGCCCATAQNERALDSLFRRYNTSCRRLICIRLTCSDRAAAERGNDAEQARVQRPVRAAGDGGRLPGAPHAHRRRPQRCVAFVYFKPAEAKLFLPWLAHRLHPTAGAHRMCTC